MARVIHHGKDNNNMEEAVLVPKPPTTALLWLHCGFQPDHEGEPFTWRNPSVKCQKPKRTNSLAAI